MKQFAKYPAKTWTIRLITSGEKGFETDLELDRTSSDLPSVHIDGYVLPRRMCFDEFKGYSQNDLVKHLYAKYGRNWIQYVKGVFVVVLVFEDRFLIYADRSGVCRWFCRTSPDEIVFSNDLGRLADAWDLEVDPISEAEFTLLAHYLPGDTLFQGVSCSKPAEMLVYEHGEFASAQFWQPRDLFGRTKDCSTLEADFPVLWKKIIADYISYLSPALISITLTGGNDSRMVLAGLLANGIKPHAFTYGSPISTDAKVAALISRKIGTKHQVYQWRPDDVEAVDRLLSEMMSRGNALINIHRAHRYYAAKQERLRQGKGMGHMIFTGLVGGELVKKPLDHGQVIPTVLSEMGNLNDPDKAISYLGQELTNRGFDIGLTDLTELNQRMMNFIQMGDGLTPNQRLFVYIYLFYGCTHHSQDSQIYTSLYDMFVNPFMDIDFLELLAGWQGWYANQQQENYNRIFHSHLLVSITHSLAPELSHIRYGKKGSYTADDLLNHKYRYIMKRVVSRLSSRMYKSPATNPVSEWLEKYVPSALQRYRHQLGGVFNFPSLERRAAEMGKSATEEQWFSVTNAINIAMNAEYYGKS